MRSSTPNAFTVTSCAPRAGPYDLGGATVESILPKPTYPDSPFFAISLAAYLPIHQLGYTVEELLAEPYRHTLHRCWMGPMTWDKSPRLCPLTRSRFCGPTTRRTSGPTSTTLSVRHYSITTPIPEPRMRR